jgi:aerobic-type carbon monoxide dehydrogenase small subunit (CoxS/CutS family)
LPEMVHDPDSIKARLTSCTLAEIACDYGVTGHLHLHHRAAIQTPMSGPIVLSMKVNDKDVTVATKAHLTLCEVLRDELDLIGTKRGCDKGDCGACTVQLDGKPVLSCLTLGVVANGREVRTVEGMLGPKLHPLFDCFDKHVAAQCGFCTPGIIMAADAFLKETKRLVTREEVAQALASNLCRCTGYTKIIDAVVEASSRSEEL